MSKDKDLEAIKNGEGLQNASTTNNSGTQTSGVVTEERGQTSGVRRDIFTIQGDKKEGE